VAGGGVSGLSATGNLGTGRSFFAGPRREATNARIALEETKILWERVLIVTSRSTSSHILAPARSLTHSMSRADSSPKKCAIESRISALGRYLFRASLEARGRKECLCYKIRAVRNKKDCFLFRRTPISMEGTSERHCAAPQQSGGKEVNLSRR
jgi:chorismate-pyruvate lyase